MLVSEDEEAIERARHLATQARDPAPHYEHSTVGYNYRLSNLLAAIGRGQLRVLSDRVEARRANFEAYSELLGDLPGLEFMPEAEYGSSTGSSRSIQSSRSTRWLTCVTLDSAIFGVTPEEVRLALEAENIEARPLWKPMHLQPLYAGNRMRGGAVAEDLFARGLCLPSGSSLSRADIERIAGLVRGCSSVGNG
jgi:dTDP-4-amino-4,6-dideoxygalactose transaminase